MNKTYWNTIVVLVKGRRRSREMNTKGGVVGNSSIGLLLIFIRTRFVAHLPKFSTVVETSAAIEGQ